MKILRSAALLAAVLLFSNTAQAATVLVGDATPEGDGAPSLNCGDAANPCDTIQNGISVANPGDEIQIAAGSFSENVLIDKSLTLRGAGQSATTIFPASSAPNPCGNSSLCGGTASNVILVRSDAVKIFDLTVDGDNPALNSGVSVSGADIDARNGIITDNINGNFNGLEVGHVTIRNVFLRGVQTSDGAGFYIHDNTVDNIRGGASSIALFNFVGSGSFERNLVQNCNDAIASNWSNGIRFLENRVDGCLSGIHTDNSGGNGGSPTEDLIENNSIDCLDPAQGGYGIFVFVPYQAVQTRNNKVTRCSVGAAVFGQSEFIANPVYPEFAFNRFENNVIGALATTNSNYGTTLYSTDARAIFTGNTLLNNQDQGFYFEAQSGFTTDIQAHFNRVYGSGKAGAELNAAETGTYALNLENNWWGCNAGPGVAGSACDQILNSIDFDPWLTLSLSADPSNLAIGGSASLVADFFLNSAGEDLRGTGQWTDGAELIFSSDFGTTQPSNALLTGNSTSGTYLADGGPGTAHVSAHFDGETVTQDIEVVSNVPPAVSGPGGAQSVEGGACSLQTMAHKSSYTSLLGMALAALCFARLRKRNILK